MSRIAFDTVTGPLGTFEVSTIRTPAGGAPKGYGMFGLVSTDDFESYQIWPFETMVFRAGSRDGLYHAPLATEEEALRQHALMVETIKLGTEFGGGVDDEGLPSTTREQWEQKHGVTHVAR